MICFPTVGRSGVENDFPVHGPRLGVPVWWIRQVRNLSQIVETFKMGKNLIWKMEFKIKHFANEFFWAESSLNFSIQIDNFERVFMKDIHILRIIYLTLLACVMK